MKIAFTCFLLSLSLSSFAQDSISYKSYRSVWSIIPRFGVGDKQTRANFTTYGSIGLRREFGLFKMFSLHGTASYSSAYGRFGNSNLNILGAGAGLTFYPTYLFNWITRKIYPNQRVYGDNYINDLYIDVSAEFSLNDTKYGSAGNVNGPRIEASFRRLSLNKALFLAPKFGFHIPEYKQINSGNIYQQNFFYIGAAIGLNPKPKNR